MFTRRRGNSIDGADAVVTSRTVPNSIRPPSSSGGGYTRQQHMESYLRDQQLAPSTRQVSDDDSTFDTVFQSIQGDTLILRVHWPSASAILHQRPPTFTLAGVEARHPWLDTRMHVVGYPPITSPEQWNQCQLLLGQAVHAVIQHLQLNPPQIVQFVDPGLIAIQSKPVPPHQRGPTNGGRSQQSHSRQPSVEDAPPPAYDAMLGGSRTAPPPLPDVDLPEIPHHFVALEELSRDQLEELKADDLAFQAFCNKLPLTKEFHNVQRTMLERNAERAAQNLEKQIQLKDLYEACTALQKELQLKVQKFQKYEQQQDAICQPPPVAKIAKELTKAKKVALEESESLAEEWLTSDDCAASTDEFLQAFLEARQVHHLRAAKLELLQEQQQSTTTTIKRR